jgi:hypothetical protein
MLAVSMLFAVATSFGVPVLVADGLGERVFVMEGTIGSVAEDNDGEGITALFAAHP